MDSSVLSAATRSSDPGPVSPASVNSPVPPHVAVGAVRVRRGRLSLEPRPLHRGGSWPDGVSPVLAWEEVLAADATDELPTVVVLGGISAGRHVADTDRRGWWSEIVGPGKAVDLAAYRVLSFDYLGGNGESTGPRFGGAETSAWPSVDSQDQAAALVQLLDALGVTRLRAVVGASYGGAVALAFGEHHGARVDQLVVISAAHRSHPVTTAYRTLQRRVVREALRWHEAGTGLRWARGLAMVGYRTPEEFAARFDGEPIRVEDGYRFPVEDYLEARGEAFAQTFDPLAFLALSESLDLHRVDPARIHVATDLVGITSDQIVPLADLESLRRSLAGPARLRVLASLYGHDAFLKEVAAVTGILRSILTAEREVV